MPGKKDTPAQTPGAGAATSAAQGPETSSSSERLRGCSPPRILWGTACPDTQVRGDGASREKATGAQLSGPTLPSPWPCSDPPASACQRPGRPCPHHQALKIVFFWTPKRGKKASPENKLFGSVFSSPPPHHQKRDPKGKMLSWSPAGDMHASGGGSQRAEPGRQSWVERQSQAGRGPRSRGPGPGDTGPRTADVGPGTRGPWPAALGAGSAAGAAGGGAGEEGGKAPGAGRGRAGGPYLSRRRRRRRRTGRARPRWGGHGGGPPAQPTWPPGPGPAPSPAARPAASSSPTRPGGTFLAGDSSQPWLLITPLVGGSL